MSAEISFLTLLRRTLRTCGLNPDTVPQDLADAFASWLECRVEEAWKHTIWPQTCAIECREVLRPSTDADDAITADITDITVDNTAITADSQVIGAVVPYSIDFNVGPDTIGELLNVWREDPRLYNAPREMGFWVTADTAYLPTDAPVQVFIRFRKVPPRFSAQPFDAATAYSAEELFLFTDGHAYRVLESTSAGQTPVTHAPKFAVQRCPEVLARFAEQAARADYLMDDGQDEKAAAQLTRAQKFLNDRMGDLTVLQHQTASYSAA